MRGSLRVNRAGFPFFFLHKGGGLHKKQGSEAVINKTKQK